MKKLLPLLLVLAAGAAVYIATRTKSPTYEAPKVPEQATIPDRLVSQPAAGERLIAFQVEGMCCGGCRPKIYDALRQVAGVREAAVEIGSATAIVRDDVDVAALERALTFDDYVAHVRR